MGREPHHPLEHHQLPAVVHFVLFGRHQHLEARFGRRLRSGRHFHRFGQEGIADPVDIRREELALGSQQRGDLCFRPSLRLFRGKRPNELEEVHRLEIRDSIAMHVQLKPRCYGDVDQQLSNAARVVRGTETIFFFGDLLSNLNCV